VSFVVGPFLGIIGGFATERAIIWYRNKMNRIKLKENIVGCVVCCSFVGVLLFHVVSYILSKLEFLGVACQHMRLRLIVSGL
jgi:heme/copper-type cytochrome/quinol oxidase subunit 1